MIKNLIFIFLTLQFSNLFKLFFLQDGITIQHKTSEDFKSKNLMYNVEYIMDSFLSKQVTILKEHPFVSTFWPLDPKCLSYMKEKGVKMVKTNSWTIEAQAYYKP